MKLFGRDLFKKAKVNTLYDFAQHGLIKESSLVTLENIGLMAISGDDEISKRYLAKAKKNNKEIKSKPKTTPKELHRLETLNVSMSINCDPSYLDMQIDLLEKKAKLLFKKNDRQTLPYIPIESGAESNGREEIMAVVERLSLRRRYKEFEADFATWPTTTTFAIQAAISGHSNLRFKNAREFIPDFPAEAIEAMEQYTALTERLCGKKPVFYVIADKKDFGEIEKKRDPILLAQSPFGLFWQILGAWDEEMVLLDEL